MRDALDNRTCLECKRRCEWVEDDMGGVWLAITPWGRYHRRTCRYGGAPYYAHRFSESAVLSSE